MKKVRNVRTLIALLLATMLMAVTATAALAEHHGGDEHSDGMVALTVEHRINGLDLGLTNARLPVDVCVNGGYAFTFEFWDTIETEIPAGDYALDVFLASDDKCEGAPVLSAGPVYLAGDSDVTVRAAVSRGGVPSLKLWSEVGK